MQTIAIDLGQRLLTVNGSNIYAKNKMSDFYALFLLPLPHGALIGGEKTP
ncbi:hypothetical protein [Serratia oryzae]|nr:hypothetical protein [Serratia oryzae]